MYFFFSCISLPSSEERLRKKIKESTFFSSLTCTVFVLFCFVFSWLRQASGHFLARMNAFVSFHRFTGTWCWGRLWRPEFQYNAHSHRRLPRQFQQPAPLLTTGKPGTSILEGLAKLIWTF